MARITPADFKQESRTVTDDQSVLAWVKWNPKRLLAEDGATQVTAATMQVQANLVNFDINGTDDATIGTYTGNTGADDQVVLDDAGTVGALINLINGIELGYDAYIAGLGDFRPGFVISTGDGLAVGATNIMLGEYHDGLQIFADSSGLATANTMSAAIGTPRARGSRGQRFPSYLQTGYTSTVAGAITKVREAERSREEYPIDVKMEVRLTGIHFAAAYATNAKTITVFDEDNNTIFGPENIGSGNNLAAVGQYDFDHPIAVSDGPIFVEAVGTGALTDGPLSIQGYVRIA